MRVVRRNNRRHSSARLEKNFTISPGSDLPPIEDVIGAWKIRRTAHRTRVLETVWRGFLS